MLYDTLINKMCLHDGEYLYTYMTALVVTAVVLLDLFHRFDDVQLLFVLIRHIVLIQVIRSGYKKLPTVHYGIFQLLE